MAKIINATERRNRHEAARRERKIQELMKLYNVERHIAEAVEKELANYKAMEKISGLIRKLRKQGYVI